MGCALSTCRASEEKKIGEVVWASHVCSGLLQFVQSAFAPKRTSGSRFLFGFGADWCGPSVCLSVLGRRFSLPWCLVRKAPRQEAGWRLAGESYKFPTRRLDFACFLLFFFILTLFRTPQLKIWGLQCGRPALHSAVSLHTLLSFGAIGGVIFDFHTFHCERRYTRRHEEESVVGNASCVDASISFSGSIVYAFSSERVN